MGIKQENNFTAKENRELFRKFRDGDLDARAAIIKGNINIIYYTLSKFFSTLDSEEYFDIGAIGLTKAVDSYDINKDYEFSTFAIRCIKNEILMELRKHNGDNKCISLNDIVNTSNNGDSLVIEDIISDPDDLIDDLIENVSYQTIVNKIFAMLNREERELLKLYFGFYGEKYTFEEIALMFGISYAGMRKKIIKICAEIKEKFKTCTLDIPPELLL